MKIAIDARMINMSGIGTYIQNLLKNNCYNISLGNEKEVKLIKEDINVINFSEFGRKKQQLKFPYRALKKEKIDFLHVPHYNIPIFYRGKMVVTIHDLTPLIFPEFLQDKMTYFYIKFMMWVSLKKAKLIFTDSENTKKDILKMFNVNPNKIKVVYLGLGNEFRKKKKEEIEYLYDKYSISRNKRLLLYVGNLKPHKNLERLLEAFSKMEDIDNTELILVGRAFKEYDILEYKERSLGIEKNVIHTGVVSNEELIDLYNLADLFVFPSLYEGFGLPVLESLACGTPVVCSNTSSLPEVGGKVVEYFDPYNIEDIKQKIENKNITISEQKVEEWLKNFNWKNTTKIVLEEMEKLGRKNESS